ncbi:MAG: SRPBCC family protein [Sandaracinaceae bacterium]
MPRSGRAQDADPNDALVAPLRGFTRADLARLEPLLAEGTVGLIEITEGELLPGVHLALDVEAPAATVAEVMSTPERYHEFMPAISSVTVRERRGDMLAYEWDWRTSLFTLGGQAMLTLYSPPRGQERRGYRMVVERSGGDLGHGREVWQVVPLSPTRCRVQLSARIDLRDANAVTRQMQNIGRSLSRSITMAMGLGALTRVQMESERRAGFTRPPPSGTGMHRPTIDVAPLEGLMRRGDLVLIEGDGPTLRQSVLLTRYNRTEAQVRAIMLSPVAFAQALIQGSTATLTGERTEDGLEFDWRVDRPLVGTGGHMILREHGDHTVELEALEGAMSGGRWQFETGVLPSHATYVLGWAEFDVGDANFLVRAIVDADESFRGGMSSAAVVMLARALRVRLTLEPATGVHAQMDAGRP